MWAHIYTVVSDHNTNILMERDYHNNKKKEKREVHLYLNSTICDIKTVVSIFENVTLELYSLCSVY